MKKSTIQTYYDILPNHWYYTRIVRYTIETDVMPEGCHFWCQDDFKQYDIKYQDIWGNAEIEKIWCHDDRRLTQEEMEAIVNYYLSKHKDS